MQSRSRPQWRKRIWEALADLASYPLYIGFSDGGESVESREDLIALEADRIFSEELVSEIAGADPGGLAPSKAGFALSASGRPNVVFSVVDGDWPLWE